MSDHATQKPGLLRRWRERRRSKRERAAEIATKLRASKEHMHRGGGGTADGGPMGGAGAGGI
jgi:hypothetical protein